VLAGDGAGGNLTIVTCLMARGATVHQSDTRSRIYRVSTFAHGHGSIAIELGWRRIRSDQ
jgi:acetyl esterase/lipase